MCMLAVMRDRHMHLAQVNPCYLLALGLCYWLLLLIGGYGFVLRPCPMDDHGLRQVPCPIQDERCVGCASGSSAFLRSRQLLRLAKNASTQASDVWACSL